MFDSPPVRGPGFAPLLIGVRSHQANLSAVPVLEEVCSIPVRGRGFSPVIGSHSHEAKLSALPVQRDACSIPARGRRFTPLSITESPLSPSQLASIASVVGRVFDSHERPLIFTSVDASPLSPSQLVSIASVIGRVFDSHERPWVFTSVNTSPLSPSQLVSSASARLRKSVRFPREAVDFHLGLKHILMKSNYQHCQRMHVRFPSRQGPWIFTSVNMSPLSRSSQITSRAIAKGRVFDSRQGPLTFTSDWNTFS